MMFRLQECRTTQSPAYLSGLIPELSGTYCSDENKFGVPFLLGILEMYFLASSARVGVAKLCFVLCTAGIASADGHRATASCSGDRHSGPGVEILVDSIVGENKKLYHAARLTTGTYRIEVTRTKNGSPVLSFVLNSNSPSYSFFAPKTIHWFTCIAMAEGVTGSGVSNSTPSALDKLRTQREQRQLEEASHARHGDGTISQRGGAIAACRAAGHCAPDKAAETPGLPFEPLTV